MPLAGRPQQVGPPDEQVARPVGGIVRVFAGHFQPPGLQLFGDIGRDLLARGLGGPGHVQRVGLELRGRGQPAHPFRPDVIVDQADVPIALGRGGRQDIVRGQRLVAPLVGMGIPGAGRVHVPRRAVPVQRKGQRLPAGLRAQFFLPHIMRPAAARLPDAAAHHQHVDDAAIVHVHVEPVVHRRADDDHGPAPGLFGVRGEFACDMDDLVARHPGDALGPGGGAGHVVVIARCDPAPAQAPVKPVVGAEKVEHRRQLDLLARGGADRPDRDVAGQHVGVVGVGGELAHGVAAEIGEIDASDLVMVAVKNQRHPQRGFSAGGLFFEVPFPRLAPAVADRAVRRHKPARAFVDGDGLPFRVVAFPQLAVQIVGAQEPAGHQPAVLLVQPDQHREIGILAAVFLEIFRLPVQMELAQDDMAKGHRQRRVGALLGVQPDVAELGRLGIIGADDRRLGALVADLGIEMRVRRARLRHVRAPQQQVARIVPVGAFRHVGLFAPGHRRGRRQVAIPVIERHADPAHQRQVARAGCIADHRHRRDRRKPEHPVGAVGAGGIGVRRRHDLGRLVPAGAHETALAAGLDIGLPQDRVGLDPGPGLDRGHGRAQLAPDLHQPPAHQRVLYPVRAVEIPAVGGAARAAARFVVGQVRAGARVIGLLGFPGHDPRLDVDLPAA